jgi:mycofactocin radical SAM maturase
VTVTADRPVAAPKRASRRLLDRFERGLQSPICLTWELTYACNLACIHCLSSSGRRDPRELSTDECRRVVDELAAMQVFYVNIGGGEPTIRPDFWDIVDYAVDSRVGVKFSTNGVRINGERARRIAATDYLDVQVSLDGATAEVNDAVRGVGSHATAVRALENLADAGVRDTKLSVVVTRQNVGQLDDFAALADRYGAVLRLTRLRPSGRGADSWHELHPTADQQRDLYEWLVGHGEQVLTGDSFFHLSAYGEPLPGLNLCGAGRVVCLIDPVGDVYACPFAIHDTFRAGSVREVRGFAGVWRESDLFRDLRSPQTGGACTKCSAYDSCRGGCMAAKFFTGLPLDGPDPECVKGHGEPGLAAVDDASTPRPSLDHSRPPPAAGRPGAVALGLPALRVREPVAVTPVPLAPGCDPDPLAGWRP